MESYFVKTMKIIMPSSSDKYVCIGKKNEIKVYKEDGATILPWEEGVIISKDVNALRIIPPDTQASPSFTQDISMLFDLFFLHMPVSMFSEMPEKSLPRNIETLMLSNYNSNNFNAHGIKKIKDLNHLSHLIINNNPTSPDISSHFNDNDLNGLDLSYLAFDFFKNGNLLKLINKNNSLKNLVVSSIGDINLFEYTPFNLKSLSITSTGSAFNFNGIANQKEIKAINLNGVKSEIDCAVFSKMGSLNEIEVFNCKKIINSECIFENENIKKITFVNCGKPFKKIKNINTGCYDTFNIKFS